MAGRVRGSSTPLAGLPLTALALALMIASGTQKNASATHGGKGEG
jgi:hypothetical protein